MQCKDCKRQIDPEDEEGDWIEEFNGSDPNGPTFIARYRCESCVIERGYWKWKCGIQEEA